MNDEQAILGLCQNAKKTSEAIAQLSTDQKNLALKKISEQIKSQQENILKINNEEIQQAKANGMTDAFIDRLLLTPDRIQAMCDSLIKIAALPDPVGRELKQWTVPNQLNISRVAIPLGVIAVIYESRPNVTADAAALCLKAGNAVILRGGSECAASNKAIAACIQAGLKAATIPENAVQYVPTQSHEAVGMLLKMRDYIDVVIPRGGKSLIKRIAEDSRIPTFLHLEGLCHTYVHQDADQAMAISIIKNAKMRRTGICGATETLLIDKAIAKEFLPKISTELLNLHCELRGGANAKAIDDRLHLATEEDWSTEYLDAILSIRIVDNINQAIQHIQTYGSSHTDAIITNNSDAAAQFLNQVNSAIVMHNTSTQFADGGEFGMGAEIGIATGKLHARGPVGLEQLTTFKYVVKGNGQVRPV